MDFQTACGQEVFRRGSGSGFELPPKVYHLPGLPSLVQKHPAPRSQPLGMVRLEMSEG